MATATSKHSRDLPQQDFEGLLSNLQDWELSLKDKDTKRRLDSLGKGKLDHPGQPSRSNAAVNSKQTVPNTPSSDKASTVMKYDYLKEYEALNRLSSGLSSPESIIDANSEKELGNEFFKQKKFNEAIDCYSRSIALSPTAVAYANRAMAYIKLKRFQEAENDCTEALNLDDRYIKAYSRRSTARKELGKLKEAVDDAEFALRLEPQNQEIKKQCAECKSLFKEDLLKKASGALKKTVEGARPGKSEVVKNRHVQLQTVSKTSPDGRVAEILDHPKGSNIREVVADTSVKVETNNIGSNGSSDAGSSLQTAKVWIPKYNKQEVKASVQELAVKAAILAKSEAAKNIVPPNSAYQFEMTWRGLSGDCDLQARLLKVTSPAALPGIFKNALSATLLVDIIKCVSTFFMEDMALGVDYLQNLIKIPRFDMIIMCLGSSDKADITKIWDEVFSKGNADYGATLSNLRPRYGLKQ
ncbi:Tetratricopeptide repeat (TPR)-like superfamily protein [Striga hermonthica]|uniref:Tetratricopeptide repeat (TPR)-like superfamily protein n=1 Tax=Striga hermonthica TaxID=68872 RepID=A0A9N7NSL8_STRHE|nr:Tetratricopeptide repeat (TPR)-like superfamily protein [Striga hermonthica]